MLVFGVEGVTILGTVAGVLTTTAFLPQVVKVWRSRSTADISLLTFSALCVGIVLWVSYGVLTDDIPLIVANGATLVLAAIILGFKLKYK
jgi:MtN3 and saliva related transmembrane protein